MALDPVCDPFFEEGQGYLANLRIRHLIVTVEPEGIVVLPKAILDSSKQPYGILEHKDQLPHSKERDTLHPNKPTMILMLSKQVQGFIIKLQ